MINFPPTAQKRNLHLADIIKDEIKRKKYHPNTSNQIINQINNQAYYKRITAVSDINTNRHNIKKSNDIISDIKTRYRKKTDETKLNLGSIKEDYTIYINDNSVVNPFGIDADILKIVKHETKGYHGAEQKGRRLFDWFQENITYGKKKRKNGYSTGIEVYENKEGVCGEMAFLYVTMARGISIKADVVDILRDYKGKKVSHACAGIDAERKYILVDPAYYTFDINHKKFKPMKDREIMDMFRRWRKK